VAELLRRILPRVLIEGPGYPVRTDSIGESMAASDRTGRGGCADIATASSCAPWRSRARGALRDALPIVEPIHNRHAAAYARAQQPLPPWQRRKKESRAGRVQGSELIPGNSPVARQQEASRRERRARIYVSLTGVMILIVTATFIWWTW
jgi:hypothetical protein